MLDQLGAISMLSTAVSFLDNLDKNRFFNARPARRNFNAFHGSPLFGKSKKRLEKNTFFFLRPSSPPEAFSCNTRASARKIFFSRVIFPLKNSNFPKFREIFRRGKSRNLSKNVRAGEIFEILRNFRKSPARFSKFSEITVCENQRFRKSTSMKSAFVKINLNEISVFEIPPQ